MRLVLASASPRRADLLREAGFSFDVLAVDLDEGFRAGETPGQYVARLAEAKARAAAALLVAGLKPGPTSDRGAGLKPGPTSDRGAGLKPGPTFEPGPTFTTGPTLEPGPRFTPGPTFTPGPASGPPDQGNVFVVLGADTTVVCNGEVLAKPAGTADAARMLRLLAGRSHEVLTGICLLRDDRALLHVESTRVRVCQLTEAEIAWYVATGEPMDKAGGYAVQGLASRFIVGVDGSYSNVVGLPVSRVYNLLKALGCDILAT